MILFRSLTLVKTIWFHVCTGDAWTYLDLEYKSCDTCGIAQRQAKTRYPKKNKHLKFKRKVKKNVQT